MVVGHVMAVDVVEEAVIGLGGDRQAPGVVKRARHCLCIHFSVASRVRPQECVLVIVTED